MKKIIRKTVAGLLILILVAMLGFFTYCKLSHDSFPMPFGYGVSVVLSGSMEPAISVDDLIIVKRCDSYVKGDIVCYEEDGLNVVHRIVSVNKEQARTKGDANNAADDPIAMGDIKGKVVKVCKGLGRAFTYFRLTETLARLRSEGSASLDAKVAKFHVEAQEKGQDSLNVDMNEEGAHGDYEFSIENGSETAVTFSLSVEFADGDILEEYMKLELLDYEERVLENRSLCKGTNKYTFAKADYIKAGKTKDYTLRFTFDSTGAVASGETVLENIKVSADVIQVD